MKFAVTLLFVLLSVVAIQAYHSSEESEEVNEIDDDVDDPMIFDLEAIIKVNKNLFNIFFVF